MAASTLASRSGSAPALARIAGTRSGGRWAAITSLGSTAITWRSRGS